MIYAMIDNRKERAIPGARGVCPECEAGVIAKCGDVNVWHWAHERNSGWCEEWGEGESEWHLGWKERFDPEQVEVVIEKNGKRHRADILLANNMVVELQHSYISVEDIRKREEFYGEMLWIFDLIEPYYSDRFDLFSKGEYQTFRWKQPRRSITYAKKFTYWQLSDNMLFRPKKIYSGGMRGWGKIVTVDKFIEHALALKK